MASCATPDEAEGGHGSFSFLDLDDCPDEDRRHIEHILQLESEVKKNAAQVKKAEQVEVKDNHVDPRFAPSVPVPPPTSTVFFNGGHPLHPPTSFPPPPAPPHSVYSPQFPYMQQQMSRDDFGSPQQQQMNSMGGYPGHSVYINNMTANVNLHAPGNANGPPSSHPREDPVTTVPPPSMPHMPHRLPTSMPHHPSTQTPFMGNPYTPMLPPNASYPFMPTFPIPHALPIPAPVLSLPPHSMMQSHIPPQTLQQEHQPQPQQPPLPSSQSLPQEAQATVFPAPPPVPTTTASAEEQFVPDAKSQNDSEEFENIREEPVNAIDNVAVNKSDDAVNEEQENQDEKVPVEEKMPEMENEVEPSKQQVKEQSSETKSNQVVESTPCLSEEQKAPKSWASLFHKEVPHSPMEKPTAKITPYTNNVGDVGQKSRNVEDKRSDTGLHNGVVQDSLTKFLSEYNLNHKSPALKPRGLTNRSNWCFVNAIMQALVACPPFYNFMKAIPLDDESMAKYSAPKLAKLKSVWEFVKEFDVMTKFARRDKGKKVEDLPLGKTFEATTIYNMLLSLSTDTFKVVDGRQEDAEEFLTFLLNGINDEILALLKGIRGESDATQTLDEEVEEVDKEDEWKEVGPKNKSCITRRQQSIGSLETPLSQMFQGMSRSCLQHSAGEPTATLQPFFTLQLDIQNENVQNVSQALSSNFATESIDGYVCATTKKEVEASRSLSLEHLPPILVLHMKRFIYDETSGGCQKLLKVVDFPVDLEIPREILSLNSRNKYHGKQKQYKLFAVVYHNGKEATKGHYVTDIYHTGLASWLRCDDSQVKLVQEGQVLAHSTNSMPYILFYRRADTMVGLEKNKQHSGQ